MSAICAGVAIGYAIALVLLYCRKAWILDSAGGPGLTDFVAVWSAGRLALSGHAASAYAPALQHAAEAASLGHPFKHEYGWPYPPIYFFVASALASIPYAPSFLAWIAGTALLYTTAVWKAADRLGAVALALAGPWMLACAMVGQNGFLTGGLMTWALVTLDEQPMVAGLLLGLLTYKPQFGLMFPIALIASGRWAVAGWGALAAAALTIVSVAVFGVPAFSGFLAALPRTAQTLVVDGGVGWNKLQSVYGLVRSLGGSNALASALQALAGFAAALFVIRLWRSQTPYPVKAAGLIVASALSTPYLFAYDLPMLGAAAAFLSRQSAFDRLDYVGVAIAWSALSLVLAVPLPVGLIATVSMAALVVRRAQLRPAASAGPVALA